MTRTLRAQIVRETGDSAQILEPDEIVIAPRNGFDLANQLLHLSEWVRRMEIRYPGEDVTIEITES